MASSQTSETSIILPSFSGEIQSSFVKTVVDYLLDYYTPEDGSWAENYLTDFGDKTTLYMSMNDVLYQLATDGLPAKDRSSSISETSIRLYTHIPEIMKELAEALPERLDSINWKCTKIDLSFHNEKKFRGKDKESGKPLYGAAACMFVLYLKPLPGKVTVCKNRASLFKPKASEDGEDNDNEEVEEETKPKAKAPFKKVYTKVDASAAGGGGVYTGRKPRGSN